MNEFLDFQRGATRFCPSEAQGLYFLSIYYLLYPTFSILFHNYSNIFYIPYITAAKALLKVVTKT